MKTTRVIDKTCYPCYIKSGVVPRHDGYTKKALIYPPLWTSLARKGSPARAKETITLIVPEDGLLVQPVSPFHILHVDDPFARFIDLHFFPNGLHNAFYGISLRKDQNDFLLRFDLHIEDFAGLVNP